MVVDVSVRTCIHGRYQQLLLYLHNYYNALLLSIVGNHQLWNNIYNICMYSLLISFSWLRIGEKLYIGEISYMQSFISIIYTGTCLESTIEKRKLIKSCLASNECCHHVGNKCQFLDEEEDIDHPGYSHHYKQRCANLDTVPGKRC